jgi:hypothetical protein
MKPHDKLDALLDIMRHATALAELTGDGEYAMTNEANTALIDLQMAVCRILGLPEDMKLLSGDPTIDGIIDPPRS